ncbi:MAG TPA: hypothetical protein PK710_03185 [Polyangiaceae bacterium]|nr:hypothetical protein [Polyangiaceae bacterium]
MSSCDISIRFDRNPPACSPGETISGTIDVVANASCRCDALTAHLSWKTSGKGDTDSEKVDVVPLGTFEWKRGESYQYPFSFLAPTGPVSYQGLIVHVNWFVEARADVPWAIDPRASETLLLVPLPAERKASTAYREQPHLSAKHHKLGNGPRSQSKWENRVLTLILGSIFLVLAIAQQTIHGSSVPFLIPMVFVAGVMLKFAWNDLRNLVARRMVGALSVTIDPPTATRGETLRIQAAFTPNSNGRLRYAKATLYGEEIAWRGSGKSRTRYHQDLDRVEAQMCGSSAFFQNQPLELSCDLRVPEYAASSFRSFNNHVQWSVLLHLDIENWPDLKETIPIDLLPSL